MRHVPQSCVLGQDYTRLGKNSEAIVLLIPEEDVAKHFLLIGDTGSGKSALIRQMLAQLDQYGDPSCRSAAGIMHARWRHLPNYQKT